MGGSGEGREGDGGRVVHDAAAGQAGVGPGVDEAGWEGRHGGHGHREEDEGVLRYMGKIEMFNSFELIPCLGACAYDVRKFFRNF